MAATALDAQNVLVLFGIMVCKSETKENWAKFLRNLKPGLTKHKVPVCFISDSQKGLLEGVSRVFLDIVGDICIKNSRSITREVNCIHLRGMPPRIIRKIITRTYG